METVHGLVGAGKFLVKNVMKIWQHLTLVMILVL